MKKLSLQNLPDKSLWKPVYGRFDKSVVFKRLDVLEASGVDSGSLQPTRQFVEQAFSNFEGVGPAKKYGFVFAIPSRIDRKSSTDTSEARSFLPFVDYVTPEIAQIFMTEMPPCILDEYFDQNNDTVGAIVYVPLLSDIVKDVRPQLLTLLKVRKIVRTTGRFIKDRLQPDIVGLGATLPKITRFGKDFRQLGLITTTGHGGTVYLIFKMYTKLMNLVPAQPLITGIIGAGSIGSSTAELLLREYPDIRLTIYDIRPTLLAKVVDNLNHKYGGRVTAAISNEAVLTEASIIISAITSKITIPDNLDLRNKYIIDDSQPGSFDRGEIELHGGTLVWVVGSNHQKTIVRNTSFRFGDKGLADTNNLWGCEAELSSIWQSLSYKECIIAPVTPDAVMRIGKLMESVGVDIADWQSYGEPVTMRDVNL